MQQKKIICAVDGSIAARNAFEIAISEFLNEQDFIQLVSIIDIYKTNQPKEFKPKNIFYQYKSRLIEKVKSLTKDWFWKIRYSNARKK